MILGGINKMKTKQLTQQKIIGKEITLTIRPTAINPNNYDIYIQTRIQKYWLLQCCSSTTRSQYTEGATLEEARILYESLQTEDDLYRIMGQPTDYESELGDRLVKAGDKDGLDRLALEVEKCQAPFKEIGKKFFSGFD